MKILSLSMQNFLSYRAPLTLPMADLGLVLVRGDNRVSQAADSNGAGKSAIFSALAMALYGETLGGQKGDEVICRFAPKGEPMVLTVELEDAQGRWRIQRTRRPPGLTITPPPTSQTYAKDVQEAITQRLGMGFRTFRNAVVFGQGAFERFAQAEQADQLRMLDEIQGLDFRQALERAKIWRGEALGRIDTLSQEEQGLTQEIATLTATQAQLLRDRDTYQGVQGQRIKVAQDRLTALHTQVAEHAVLVQQAEHARGEIDATRRALEARTKMEQRRTKFEHEIGLLDNQIIRAKQDYDDHQQTLASLTHSKSCPVCHQGINPTAIGKTFRALMATLQEQQGTAKQKQKDLRAQIVKVDTLLQTAPRPEALGSLQALAANLAGLTGGLKVLQGRLQEATAEVTRERAAEWEGEPSLRLVHKNLDAAQTHLRTVGEQMQRAAVTLRVAEYGVEAFGDRGLRSLLVDSVAGYLNQRLHAHLGVLAGGEVQTLLSATTPLKGGGTRERLSLTSAWAWGGATKGAGSAGQDRRIDLALFAALQDLAESRAARPFPLRIWDEPGDALDARGQELFIAWVGQQARARGTGFLVTHNPYLADAVVADQTWTVVLDRTGSHVEIT